MPEIFVSIDTHGLEDKLLRKSGEIGARIERFKLDILLLGQREVKAVTPRAKTGKAKSSIKYSKTSSGGNIYASEEVAPHIKWVIGGRGEVRPIHTKALHFFIHGKEIFAKKVKATKPNPIFKNAMPGISRGLKIETEVLAKWLEEL